MDKNKLLVYGTSISDSNHRVFELHHLENNSGSHVEKITLLSTDDREFLMHSCDYTGGAWFRSKNEAEEHAFFDPETLQLYKNNGPVDGQKIVSVANSKRGYYFVTVYDSVV